MGARDIDPVAGWISLTIRAMAAIGLDIGQFAGEAEVCRRAAQTGLSGLAFQWYAASTGRICNSLSKIQLRRAVGQAWQTAFEDTPPTLPTVRNAQLTIQKFDNYTKI